MKLKVLVDNNTYIDEYYLGEPAVSYYIEDGDTKLLLDVGYSDIFIQNAEAFGLDLGLVDKIVISHGHDDHTRGFKYFFDRFPEAEVEVIGHPDAFKEKQFDGLNICSPMLTEELSEKCELTLAKSWIRLTDNLIFLGEIPSLNNFEKRQAIGVQLEGEAYVDDYVKDDSAIVYKTKKGIYIITGCSHSGICNIIEYAKKVTEDDRVLGVIGGFHLFEVTDRVKKTIEYFENHKIKFLYPCHCTSFAVRAEMAKTLDVTEVGVGLEIVW
jgi:7,8-dihydropterin-6-yl-methyl-4-(beta-D-ribofuranosyl)aminobenzene 5'-phosphate synthase